MIKPFYRWCIDITCVCLLFLLVLATAHLGLSILLDIIQLIEGVWK